MTPTKATGERVRSPNNEARLEEWVRAALSIKTCVTGVHEAGNSYKEFR